MIDSQTTALPGSGDDPLARANGAHPAGVALAPSPGVVGGRPPTVDHPGSTPTGSSRSRRSQRVADRIDIANQKAVARQARRDARREANRKTWTGRWSALRRAGGRLRPVAPLLVVNAAAVYGQVAFAYERIAPMAWGWPARLVLALDFAAAIESVALYVGWHAHDALLRKGSATAARLRKTSYVIAAVVGVINYAHFAGAGMAPTAAAATFGLLSLLSPWLWGLHTRRAQQIQLLAERRADNVGAVFSAERRREFPIRSWMARRWSIDYGVSDPIQAWEGYRAEAQRRHVLRLARTAVDAATKKGDAAESLATLQAYVAALAAPGTPTIGRSVVSRVERPTPTTPPSRPQPATTSTPSTSAKAPTPSAATTLKRWAPQARRDAAYLRAKHGTVDADRLPGRNEIARTEGWNPQKASDARGAYLAGADLTQGANK